MINPIKTQCPYCGVGCGLEVLPPKITPQDQTGNSVWQVRGDRTHPSSLGKVCVKGATVAESLNKNRLLYPMGRNTLKEPFTRLTWDEALDRIVTQIKKVSSEKGPDAICMYGSGQFQTEDYYIAQKLLKGCLGTNNFDANSRLCMSSAVAGYTQSFGSDGPPCCYEDLELTDCAFLIGTNTAECHPIVFNRLRVHHKKNSHVKMIVVDPRHTETAKFADLHLSIKPGTDIDLLNGIAHLLRKNGHINKDYIDQNTDNFTEYNQVIDQYPPEIVANKCGIKIEDLIKAAQYWGESQKVLSLWSMGVNQSTQGTATVRTIINLHLMTGNIGKPGSGPFSLTGQPNAMGGREAGGLAQLLPGYRSVKNPLHREEIETAWGLPLGSISDVPGRDVWRMITALETGDVGLFWIAATNPAVSMPDLNRTKTALLKSPFTIYQDAYYPTETSHYAHLLLPAAQWGEKTGIMTNSERVVTLCSAFCDPLGEAKADWEIFAEVGRKLGFEKQFNFANSEEVCQEFFNLTKGRPCDMSGINHNILKQTPVQWPHPLKDSVTNIEESSVIEDNLTDEKESLFFIPNKRLYTDGKFHTPNQKAKFVAYHSKGLAEPCDPHYPFILTTGRLYGQWHTMTRTGRIDKIMKMHPEPFIEIHPKDAEKLNIEEGKKVLVKSRRGEGIFPAKITTAIKKGTVFVPMHWGFLWADQAECNSLTHPESCPDSLQPELKACAVNLIALP
jgi:ferredoxin-nitrate reductase